jgi:predicted nuclease of predicted toxin-antitoxin system
MRFKIDENLPVEARDLLQRAGHDAATVGDEMLSGKSDLTIAAVCIREQRSIVSLDLDFADIRSYPPSDYPGIIVLRLQRNDKRAILSVLERLIQPLRDEPLDGRLWIVDERRIRIRQ